MVSDILTALLIASQHRKTLPAQQQLALAILEWAMIESDEVSAAFLNEKARKAFPTYYPAPKDEV